VLILGCSKNCEWISLLNGNIPPLDLVTRYTVYPLTMPVVTIHGPPRVLADTSHLAGGLASPCKFTSLKVRASD